MKRVLQDFFLRDVLEVAPDLLGKCIVIPRLEGFKRYFITEVEAYKGEDDLACHASKGRTIRTEIMYHEGGHIYVYLIYGMYWMLNFTTGPLNYPQAVLIRSINNIRGPGRVTHHLGIDKSYYGENLSSSERIWLEDTGQKPEYITSSRIGINYAGEPWISKPWRFSSREV